jgi:excisionase family DNA binding protein
MADGFNPTEWITTKEAADLTGYNQEYIRQMIRSDRIVAEKKGRDWWVDRASIEAHAEKMKQLGVAKHDPWRAETRQETQGE